MKKIDWTFVRWLWQYTGIATLLLCALVGLCFILSNLIGYTSWPSLPVTTASGHTFDIGVVATLAGVALPLALCAVIPAGKRVMALEHSHRQFHLGVQDVCKAYWLMHSADRAGNFKLHSEFDAIRERIAFASNHPDLASLEPEILEAAAQMSYISRDLAEFYSDEKVDRALGFLLQREQEVARLQGVIEEAKAKTNELHEMSMKQDLDEAVCAAEIERIRELLIKVENSLRLPPGDLSQTKSANHMPAE